MTDVLPDVMNAQHALLDHVVLVLHKHLHALVIISIVLVAAIYLWHRQRPTTMMSGTDYWTEDEKALFETKPSSHELMSEYSHPLAQALFQQSGIPTSGDLARAVLLNSSKLARSPFPMAVPTSGDLAAIANKSTMEERRHPWRRHSYPDPQSSKGNVSQHQMDAVITGDAVEFFKNDQVGQLWRRRTLEFGRAG